MKRILTAAFTIGLIIFSGQAKSFTIADTPLFVTGNVEPNIVLTLDDSGSMQWAYVPDDLCTPNLNTVNAACQRTVSGTVLDNDVYRLKRFKSAYYNAQYYTPDIDYQSARNASGNIVQPCTNSGSIANCFASAKINGFDSTRGTRNLSNNYRPTSYYDPSSTSQGFARNPTADFSGNELNGVAAYYYVYKGGLTTPPTGCSGTVAQRKEDEDCYVKITVSNTSGPGSTDERLNFTNWYAFYRTRNLSTATSASLAFSDLDPSTRVAWQALNNCSSISLTSTCSGWKNNVGSNKIGSLTNSAHRQRFFDWLFQVPASGGTPLRDATIRAGNYFSTSGDNSPYDNNLNASTPNSGEYTCRRNFHILMTDGRWNESNPGSIGDQDYPNSTITLGDGTTTYNPTQNYARLYRGADDITLADVAFKYWRNDLRTGLTNNLTPVTSDVDSNNDGLKDSNETIFWNAKNNPATWQHMVNFTIGLGLTEALSKVSLDWAGDTYAGDYFSIRDGSEDWPSTTTSGGKVADLWHAAINSRGQFYSAESPEDMVNAFSAIMANVKAATPTSSALAANSTKAEIGTRVYQAKFDTTKWSGNLFAFDVNPANGTLSPAVWDAATEMPAHGSRNIYIRNATAGAPFNWASLTSLQQSDLDAGGLGQDRVAWLRGDISKEERFTGGVFRNRGIKPFEKVNASDPDFWLLGDIISSDPEYVGVGSQGYDQLPSGTPGQSSYATYVSSHKATRPPAIYVGANDGMLHAFRTTDGVELFAVIPNAVFPNLSELTSPTYAHRFYVDGSPSSGDAYLNLTGLSVSGWNTVVVSGLGAGGNSIIAVDATSTTTTSASRFLWEYTDTDMGYTYSQPQVARMNDGSWAAVFGNGYKTSGGGAYLYVVNLANGTLIKKIQAGTDANNGLSTPLLLDTNNDKIMDTAYAGDLQGNMWKFDLSSGTAASWGVADGGTPGTPLFIAKDASGNRQPITVQPSVAKEAVSGGYWVFFGTGRFLAEEDVQATEMGKTQSFYGIWDNGSEVPSYSLRTDTSFSLIAQTVTNTTTSNSFDVRVTSNNTVNLSSSVRGWYMDLPGSGERVVSEAVTIISNIDNAENRVIFVTVLPSSDPCDSGGSSWLMEVLFSGSRPASPVFDLDGDGDFDAGDTVTVNIGGVPTAVPVSGVKSSVGILDTPTWLDKDAAVAFKLAPGTSGSVVTITNKGKGGTGTTTRVFWQQLM
jgi:type IV pilus assembly protein PilY1